MGLTWRISSRIGTIYFSNEQIKFGLLAGEIGNVYAGSSLLGLSSTLLNEDLHSNLHRLWV